MFSRIKQMLDIPSAWRTSEGKKEKVLNIYLPKDSEVKVVNGFKIDPKNLAKVKQEKPYLPLKAESKISKWVDDINNMPFEFYGKIIESPNMFPDWEIVLKYFDGRTEKMKIKYKKRDGYSDYRQTQAIIKCILRNWKERK